MQIYIVQTGDNVDAIAGKYGENVQELIYDNQLEYPYRLAVGQALAVRGGVSAPKAPIVSGGYAYPFITQPVLEETLRYLSELSVFSYGFTGDGELIPPVLDDVWMVEEALRFQAVPVLTLTPLGADGRFNNNLIAALMNNPRAQQRLVWQIGQMMLEKGYLALDIDFEYILPEDRDKFTDFVRRVTRVMNQFGYQVSVALAPKTSRDQKGLLYEGVDYRALGEAADHVLLMTYEWGYTYGPPMAVAPINMVRRVVEYALTEIPASKINMGIPNYGYNWPLPYERGLTKARTMGNIEAVRLAVDYGVPIRFDETAKTPYYRYWQYGIQHEVWFEDARSIQAKFDLIKEYGLRGAGYWQIMQLFRQNWLMMDDQFIIRKGVG